MDEIFFWVDEINKKLFEGIFEKFDKILKTFWRNFEKHLITFWKKFGKIRKSKRSFKTIWQN